MLASTSNWAFIQKHPSIITMIIFRSLILASLHDLFLFHRFILHYTFSAPVTVYTFSLKALSHLNNRTGADFQMSATMEGRS